MIRSPSVVSLSLLVATFQLAGCTDYRASRALAPASTLVQGHFAPAGHDPHMVLVCETRGVNSRVCRKHSLREVIEQLMERLPVNPYD